MSTQNGEAWILIYNDDEYSNHNNSQEELRRMLQTGPNGNDVKGCNTYPFTSILNLDDTKGRVSHSVIFIGPSMDSVMYHLQSYTNGVWPRITTAYSISGTVSGAASVTVSCTGQTDITTSGTYTFSGLTNGTYTVTPNKSGYTFSPASYTVTVSGANVTGKDFTAIAVPTYYSISGTVSGATSVTVACTGQASVTTSGTYTFSNLANGTYTVTPSKTGYVFSPASYNVTISGANVTGKNFTASPAPTYTISGTVYKAGGAAFSGVTIKIGLLSFATTASNGTYTILGRANGTYSITPSMGGYTFSPENRSVTINGANVTGINFTADTQLTSGVGVSGSVTSQSWKYYSIIVPQYSTSLVVKLTGLSANVDLYDTAPPVSPSGTDVASHPTTSTFTGRSNNTGTTNETITHSNPRSGTWSIGVYGYHAGSYTVTATVVGGGGPATLVQGTITDPQGQGVSGIAIKTGSIAVTSDDTGAYALTGLEPGDYTLAPSDEDSAKYNFDPPNRKVKIKENGNQITGQDFKVTPK